MYKYKNLQARLGLYRFAGPQEDKDCTKVMNDLSSSQLIMKSSECCFTTRDSALQSFPSDKIGKSISRNQSLL